MPRKRFQIHLSTAIVMMFVAGGLMWANIHATRLRLDRIEKVETDNVELKGADYQYEVWGNGWPAAFHQRFDDIYIFKTKPNFVQSSTHYTSYSMVVLDLAVALLIHFSVWFGCEWWVQRKRNQ